ncbi:MAG TPA: amino acid permease [Burkholderiaceae bacterium]|nr:amino acid permease [Burkholderiaceae bacterium]
MASIGDRVNVKPRRILRLVLGSRRNPLDPQVRRRTRLAAMLAWAGLGANGLSAACYGPEKAYLALGEHAELGPLLALIMVVSVVILALAYSQMFELFPHGGGSYRVASQLLGAQFGLVSGAALLIDYVLAISVSLAGGTDALFSLLSVDAQGYKLTVELALTLLLIVLNLRGLHVAIWFLFPIALAFSLVHAFLILFGVGAMAPKLSGHVAQAFAGTLQLSRLTGWVFVIALLIRAYGLGGSTFSGVEAISNNVNLLAEPRVKTGRLTMFYVALTLAFIAGGLILLYSLWDIRPLPGHTLNAAILGAVLPALGLSASAARSLIWITLLLEAAILLVAANSIFIFAPSLLANMAADSWLPHQFRNLSVLLVRQNGIVFIGACALAILGWTRGDLAVLVVFYSINVFLSLALAKVALLRYWWSRRHRSRGWRRRMVIAALGFCVGAGILIVTLTQKFFEGGWATACLTLLVIGGCIVIRHHYDWINERRHEVDRQFALSQAELDTIRPVETRAEGGTAVLLATDHWGPAIHTLMWIQRLFPGQFRNVIVVSVVEVDAGAMGAVEALARLTFRRDAAMTQLEGFCAKCGLTATRVVGFGTDPAKELERLLKQTLANVPGCVCFANKLILPPRRRLAEWLHNQTALGLQRRLHAQGIPLMVLPLRLGW